MSDPGGEQKAQRERERVLTLDYECLRSLQGGINEVRVWRDSLLDVYRVGKRIDVAGLDDTLPEPETLQHISHPHVVPIVSAARVGGYAAGLNVIEIITPFFERGSITDALLKGHQFTSTEAVQVLMSALGGLRELHEVHRIVHRDVKSGNILLCTGHPHAKIADLGLAGRMNEDGWVPSLDNPTLYSTPEFIGTGRLTPASDLYSMGLVMRELLGGAFPYETYTTAEIVDKLMRMENPVRPADRLLPIWASRDLRRIYNKATTRVTENRYQTARQMSEALSGAQYIDWVQTDALKWEAPSRSRQRRVSVEATWKKKDQRYVLTVKSKIRISWRRAQPDVVVDSLRSSPTQNLFDQATKIAWES